MMRFMERVANKRGVFLVRAASALAMALSVFPFARCEAIPGTVPCPMELLWKDEFSSYGGSGCLAVAADSSGNILAAGFTKSNIEGYAIVKKYSSSGSILWSRTYQTTPGGWTTAEGVAVDASGNVVVVGDADGNWFVSMYDSSGNYAWVRTFDGAVSCSDSAAAVAFDARNGNVVVAGTECTHYTAMWSRWLIREYNPAGTLQWSRTYESAGGNFGSAVAVAVDSTGGIALAGYENRRDIALNEGWAWLVLHMDETGELEWSRTIYTPGIKYDMADSVAVAANNDVIVGGVIGDCAGQYVPPECESYCTGKGLLVRYAADGDIVWSKNVGNACHYWPGNEPTPLVPLVDTLGNIWLVGGNRYEQTMYTTGMSFSKMDGLGNIIWTEDLPHSGAAALCADGNIAVGTFGSYYPGSWLAGKIKNERPKPCIQDLPSDKVVVFPNPIPGDSASLAFDIGEGAKELTVEVYNLRRRLVYRGRWKDVSKQDGGVTISGFKKWAKGVYFVKARAILLDGSERKYDFGRLIVK